MLEIKVSIKVEGLDRLADALFAIAGVSASAEKETVSTVAETSTVQQPENVPVQGMMAEPQPTSEPATPVAASVVPTMPTVQAATQVMSTAPTAQTIVQATPAIPVAQIDVPTTAATPPVQAKAGAVPVNVLSYNMDDLTRAAMTLMDAGKQADLQALLANFGVESLPLLSPEYYGAFATGMRGLGAQI